MKTKTFDCVKMKEECQQAVLKKYGGLPPGDRERLPVVFQRAVFRVVILRQAQKTVQAD